MMTVASPTAQEGENHGKAVLKQARGKSNVSRTTPLNGASHKKSTDPPAALSVTGGGSVRFNLRQKIFDARNHVQRGRRSPAFWIVQQYGAFAR